MCPSAVADRRLDDTNLCAAGMNDLPVSDIDTDMSFVPNGKPRNLRNRINASAFFGIVVHGIGANIRHAVRAVFNRSCFRIEPAVALDQADAICGTTADPVFFDEVSITADLVGILFRFGII